MKSSGIRLLDPCTKYFRTALKVAPTLLTLEPSCLLLVLAGDTFEAGCKAYLKNHGAKDIRFNDWNIVENIPEVFKKLFGNQK